MPRLSQLSFTGGELAPDLRARHDLAKVKVGLATCKNFLIEPHGGVKNRAGLEFVAETKDSAAGQDKKARLIPFEFSTVQTYALEFGDLYMRVYKDGAIVLNPTQTIGNVSATNPVQVDVTAHGYANGDEVLIQGSVQTELNGKRFIVDNATANDFKLLGEDGTGRTAGAGGTVARLFTLVTPYKIADIPTIKFTQSADVMTLTHPSYDPRDLSRTDHDAWTLTVIVFEPGIAAPTQQAATSGGGTGYTYTYAVTTVAKESFEESLAAVTNDLVFVGRPTATASSWHRISWKPPLEGSAASITGATQADPVVITVSADPGFKEGDRVWIEGVGGMTQINDQVFFVANPSTVAPWTFELKNENGTGYGAYTSGGTAQLSAAEKHNIYKQEKDSGGIFGFIGSSDTHEFRDSNIAASTTDSPPQRRDPFEAGANAWPGAVAYFQQRKIFAGSNNQPQTIWGSVAGSFHNMSVSTPLRDDDAFTFTIAARQVNRVLHMVTLSDLLIFTSGGEWRVFGDQDNIVGPLTIDVKPQGFRGASDVRPIITGNTVLFVQRAGRSVRDLAFDLATDGYTGNDISILASHLFEGTLEITEWDFAEAPDSVMWCVRSDGMALSLTYIREHQVFGWARHETDGEFESVATIREADEDAVYFIVRRTIGGKTKRFVERLHSRAFDDVSDAFFVDSGLTLDTPLTVSGGTTANPIVITATAHGFANGDLIDLSDLVGLLSADDVTKNLDLTSDDQIQSSLNGKRFKAANVTANTFELTDQYTDANIDGTGYTAYVSGGKARKAVTQISGLDHLEGETLAVLANASFAGTFTVTNGGFTLPNAASRVHAGLPYSALLETLDLAFQAPRGISKGVPKKISGVFIEVLKSRGFRGGPSFDNLTEARWRSDEEWNEPTRALTGEAQLLIPPQWTPGGRVFLSQPDPLPLHVMGITMEMHSGD